ncbi:helix-turn-helix transcriptional regulator [Nocardia cyriacigeorgica]|uniref:Helix-turn-helix transcriptional regulator n=2 Tax=Nocardia TaxID=1817 RepID=A0A6P1CX91_9NOCA|nr:MULTISPECIES: Scr1 family TA system antitoxin-like transcriptional regulator [Nocardia]NEW36417.1 helix-turn-helix transcriptional regulator [Nocardia cyriacigeorgica]BDT85589.1 transcriptional regulator [Nocardia cyriacigeorgica]
MHVSPVVASWELSLRLRQRREQLGIDTQTIVKKAKLSRGYWVLIEGDRRIPAEDKLQALMDLFEFDAEEQAELLALRAAAKGRGWWARYSALFGPELLRLYGMEDGAQRIRTYESVLMPGLLQSEEYVRALMVTGVATVLPVEVEQRVEVRMRRQQRLEGDNPLHLSALIGEAALVQQIGGPHTLQRQLLHLADVIESHPETIVVRLMPFTATERSIFSGATFHLLDFANPRLPTLAWHESTVMGELLEDRDKDTRVRDLGVIHDRAMAQAMSREATLDRIRAITGQIQSTL